MPDRLDQKMGIVNGFVRHEVEHGYKLEHGIVFHLDDFINYLDRQGYLSL